VGYISPKAQGLKERTEKTTALCKLPHHDTKPEGRALILQKRTMQGKNPKSSKKKNPVDRGAADQLIGPAEKGKRGIEVVQKRVDWTGYGRRKKRTQQSFKKGRNQLPILPKQKATEKKKETGIRSTLCR